MRMDKVPDEIKTKSIEYSKNLMEIEVFCEVA